jgi:hypothetical protein
MGREFILEFLKSMNDWNAIHPEWTVKMFPFPVAARGGLVAAEAAQNNPHGFIILLKNNVRDDMPVGTITCESFSELARAYDNTYYTRMTVEKFFYSIFNNLLSRTTKKFCVKMLKVRGAGLVSVHRVPLSSNNNKIVHKFNMETKYE